MGPEDSNMFELTEQILAFRQKYPSKTMQ